MGDGERAGQVVQRTIELVGKTAVGVGAGIVLGIGALSAAAIAEIAIPAVLTLKALGLTGGAAGLLWGTNGMKKP